MFVLFTVAAIFIAPSHGVVATPKPKLLVIMLDGVPAYKLQGQLNNLPGFKHMKENGAWVEAVIPEFPTMSWTNYYSIATGNHPETHGIINNYFIDPNQCENGKCLVFDGDKPSHRNSDWWEQSSEPIWVTAEKKGLKTHMYYWPGCEIEIYETKPTYCKPYDAYVNHTVFANDAAELVGKLASDVADFGVLYTVLTDKAGHRYGADGVITNQVIKGFDTVIGHLLTGMKQSGLDQKINVMVISDHGMVDLIKVNSIREIMVNLTEIYPDFVENCDQIVGTHEYAIGGSGITVGAYPKEGKLNEVYHQLKKGQRNHPMGQHIQIYLKNKIKRRWHYKNNERVPPIFIVANKGYIIAQGIWPGLPAGYGDQILQVMDAQFLGSHGYDNKDESMWAIFLATGPAFKPGKSIRKMNIIEEYHIMAQVLKICPESVDQAKNRHKKLFVDDYPWDPETECYSNCDD